MLKSLLRRTLPLLSFHLLASACSSEPSPEELTRIALEAASNEATRAYQLLLDHDYAGFIHARQGMDTIGVAPADSIGRQYKEQLIDACLQYQHKLQTTHGGINTFTVSNAVMDSTIHQAHIFLLLQLGDSTQEEILVPMVEYKGKWVMK